MSKRKFEEQVNQVEEQESSLIITEKSVDTKKKMKKVKREKFNSNELKKIIKMKNWELTNDVNHRALGHAFPDSNECLDFITNLKKFYVARNEIYSDIENKLPKNRKHLLFNDVEEFKKKIFPWPKKGALLDYQYLCKSEEEINEEFEYYSETESEESDNE
jgi:hypothetical protein